MSCQILERQSSYWDIVDRSGTVRIHFQQKEEFHFVCTTIDAYALTANHPLLLDYEWPWSNIYVSSAPSEPAVVVGAIVGAWEPFLRGWRSPFSYLTDTDPERMLSEGHGQLLSAPEPLSSVAAKALANAAVNFSILPGRPARWPRKALVAGDNYVVAADFRVERRAA